MSELALLDPETGKTETVETDPLKKVDFGWPTFSEKTDELAMTTYVDDRERSYFKDKSFERDFQWLKGKFPAKKSAGFPPRWMSKYGW